MGDFQTFVVPYDFSDHSRAALRMAIDLAQRFQSDLHLVHVIQPPSLAYAAYGGPGIAAAPPASMRELREVAESALRDVAKEVEGEHARVRTHVVESPSIPEAIRELAEKVGADLIVMGTHGRTGLAHVFLGSVAERTLRRAPCAVLTVQAPAAAEPAAEPARVPA
jgi:nucleotide-binding universal stress UspA family protein